MLVLFKGNIVLSLYFGSHDHAKVSTSTTYQVRHPRISKLIVGLFQNSNKWPFFSRFIVQPRSHAGQSALLLTPSKNPLHAIQKCRQH